MNKQYRVVRALNHREKGSLGWSEHSTKKFTNRKEAEAYYESVVAEFDFDKYTTREYKYNICLYEPIITPKGEVLSIVGKMLKNEKYVGQDFIGA